LAHACFSGAAEAVLRGELKTDRVQVSVAYPPVFGVTRTYTSFSAIAQEVNDARVWGGIHFRSSDRHGYELGKRVGEAVAREFGQTLRGDVAKMMEPHHAGTNPPCIAGNSKATAAQAPWPL
jgi:hypothetical protein